MTTTTEYGTLANYTGDISIASVIANAVGEYASDYDLVEVEREYRQAINESLPPGVTLCGDTFIGPFPHRRSVDGLTIVDFTTWDIGGIVADVDLYEILDRHDNCK
jgi:hypothetical protein